MILRQIFILLLAVTIVNECKAQAAKKYIRNSYAFVKMTSPGNIMVNDSGVQIPTMLIERFIFLRIKGIDTPAIKKINLAENTFRPVISMVSNFPASPGKDIVKGLPVKLQKVKGYTLWKIELVPESDTTIPVKQPVNYHLQGIIRHKKFDISITKEVTLAGEMMY